MGTSEVSGLWFLVSGSERTKLTIENQQLLLNSIASEFLLLPIFYHIRNIGNIEFSRILVFPYLFPARYNVNEDGLQISENY